MNNCPKCNSILRHVSYMDFVRSHEAWHCVKCGEVIDLTILAARERALGLFTGTFFGESKMTNQCKNILQNGEQCKTKVYKDQEFCSRCKIKVKTKLHLKLYIKLRRLL